MSFEHGYDPRWDPDTDWLMTGPYAPARLEAQTSEEMELIRCVRRMSQAQIDRFRRLAKDLVGPEPDHSS
jgi:hypothetical protein